MESNGAITRSRISGKSFIAIWTLADGNLGNILDYTAIGIFFAIDT